MFTASSAGEVLCWAIIILIALFIWLVSSFALYLEESVFYASIGVIGFICVISVGVFIYQFIQTNRIIPRIKQCLYECWVIEPMPLPSDVVHDLQQIHHSQNDSNVTVNDIPRTAVEIELTEIKT